MVEIASLIILLIWLHFVIKLHVFFLELYSNPEIIKISEFNETCIILPNICELFICMNIW